MIARRSFSQGVERARLASDEVGNLGVGDRPGRSDSPAFPLRFNWGTKERTCHEMALGFGLRPRGGFQADDEGSIPLSPAPTVSKCERSATRAVPFRHNRRSACRFVSPTRCQSASALDIRLGSNIARLTTLPSRIVPGPGICVPGRRNAPRRAPGSTREWRWLAFAVDALIHARVFGPSEPRHEPRPRDRP
jgi:hypothetical protein